MSKRLRSAPARLLTIDAGETLAPGSDVLFVAVLVVEGVLAYRAADGSRRRALAGEWVRASGQPLSFSNPAGGFPLVVFVVTLESLSPVPRLSARSRYFSDDDKAGSLYPVLTPEGDDDSLASGVPASIFSATLERWGTVLYDLPAGSCAWVCAIEGGIAVNDEKLAEGEGAWFDATGETRELRISGLEVSEVALLLLDDAAAFKEGAD